MTEFEPLPEADEGVETTPAFLGVTENVVFRRVPVAEFAESHEVAVIEAARRAAAEFSADCDNGEPVELRINHDGRFAIRAAGDRRWTVASHNLQWPPYVIGDDEFADPGWRDLAASDTIAAASADTTEAATAAGGPMRAARNAMGHLHGQRAVEQHRTRAGQVSLWMNDTQADDTDRHESVGWDVTD